MNDLQIIKGIRCYLDENGEAFLNLEDSARGLGFTQIATSGNESIRWERVRKYLAAFKVIPTSGDSPLPEYIPEPIFYLLSMKAENEAAKKFQHTIAYDVLPALRKTGTYSVSQSQEPLSIETQIDLLLKIASQCDSPEFRLKFQCRAAELVTGEKGLFLNQSATGQAILHRGYYNAADLGKEFGLDKAIIGRIMMTYHLKQAPYGKMEKHRSATAKEPITAFYYNDAGREELRKILSHKGNSVSNLWRHPLQFQN